MRNDINDADEARADKQFAILGWVLGVILILLVGGVIAGGVWMWQISQTPVVSIVLPSNLPRHPSAISPLAVMTFQALSAVPPQPTVTPYPHRSIHTPTPTITPTLTINGRTFSSAKWIR
jgi:hypothetical protein